MIKNLFRTWLPLLLAFAIGWAVQTYWLGGPAKTARNAVRPHGTGGTASDIKTPTAFSASHAAVQGKDTEPQLVPWSAQSALGKILATNRGGQRELAIAGLVNDTPPDQLGRLIDEARFCTEGDARSSLLSLAYAKWAALDPAAALAFARTAATKRYDKDSSALTQVLATWAGHDPASALAAAQALDLASFRQQGLRAVLQAWGQSDNPQAAVDAAKALGLGTQLNGALSAIYQGWAQRDPAGAFAALSSVDNLNTRNNLADTILQTMSEQDPKGALTLFQTLSPAAQANSQALNLIFSRLTLQDPHAAVDALSQVPLGSLRERALTCIACDWADNDPQGAMSWAQGLANPADRNTALYNAVRHMSGNDPAGAANDLKLIPDINQRNQAMNDVLSHWVDADPAAALKWAQGNTTGTTQTMALNQVINNIAQIDPLSALNVIQNLPDAANHNNMVFQTINSWSQSDPEAALNWAKSNLSGNDLTTATGIAVRQLINADPAAGAQYVTSLPDSPNRTNLINQVATSMARQDMDGALNWLNNLGDVTPATRNNAIQSVMSQLSQVDPQLAATKLQSITFDPGAQNAQNTYAGIAGQIANNWAQTDPDAALAWAAGLPGNARQNAMSSAINSIANSDPATAWDEVSSLPANDPARNSLLGNVVNAWGRQDPETAVGLLGNLNQGQYTSAVGQISNSWLRQDPYAASQWISGLPTSAAKDTAVQNLLNSQGQYDLATSLKWVQTMSNEAAQTKGYLTVIQQAARNDPVAAQAALDSTPLTDAQRTQLNQVVQRAATANANGRGPANIDYGYGPGNPPPGMHFEYGPNGEQRLVSDNN
ncbi:MAG TPA: hypothetical protein VHC95_05680 [Opitutales bacterium]|nr:hypothetical protein [Opitutales bacterium]